MNSGTGQKPASNLSSSSVTSGQSINYQNAEYGHFFWATYFHQLNQPSNQQSIVNFSTQVEPQNLTKPLTQGSHYSPISSSSSPPSLSSNMKDLCRYNPSNSFKNGKNPQTDNNGSKCRPNYGERNSKDDINRYTANGVRSNQYSISANSDGNRPQKLDVDDDGENRYKKEMAAVIEQIQRRAAYQGYPIIYEKPTHKSPPREFTVVDGNRMDEIIAKELDLALSLSKKGRKNSRSHRLSQQKKQKTRPKTGKKSSIKDKLISLTVERIKAAVFNCGPNPHSAQIRKKSDHEANQQSPQNQSFHQPEALNQYQDYNTLGQFQHSQIMGQPKPEVMRPLADLQSLTRKPKRYCTCKRRDGRMNNDVPSSSALASNHFDVQF